MDLIKKRKLMKIFTCGYTDFPVLYFHSYLFSHCPIPEKEKSVNF